MRTLRGIASAEAFGAPTVTLTAGSTPTISSLSVTHGTTNGGTSTVITGTNLTGATAVTFGGVNVTSFTVVNSTTINVTTQAHAHGAITVAVVCPGGTASLSNGYTYDTITVSSVSPNHGSTAGATSVTVTGSGFTGASSCSIGGNNLTSFVVVNDTTITGVTQAHTAGAVNAVVTTGGDTGTGTSVYTYDTIVVTSVSPNHGSTNGTTAVTITGSGFTGATSATIGGGLNLTSFTVVNDTTITGQTRSHAHGAVNCIVTTPGDTGTGTSVYTYDQIVITSISPAIGDINGLEAITITGSGFTGAQDGTIGGNNIDSFVVVNDTTITGVTEAHAAGLADVMVETNGETVTHTNLYEFYDPTSLVDGYWSGENYVSGTLTARKGVNLTEATNKPLVGSGGRQLGGKNTIDSHTVTSPKLTATGATNLSTYSPLASGWGFAIVNFDAYSTTNDAGAYSNGQVFSDNGGGYQGLSLSNSPSNHLQPWGYDASAKVDDQAAVTGTWYLIIWKRTGSVIMSRLGSGSWSAGTSLGTLGGTGVMKMFENWNAGAYMDGRVAVLGLGGTLPTDPQVTKLISYINAHWGQSF